LPKALALSDTAMRSLSIQFYRAIEYSSRDSLRREFTMAVRIDRVEREFILGVASEAKLEARVQAPGASLSCRLDGADRHRLRLRPSRGRIPFIPRRERVSVYFDFRGQGMAFESPVLGSVEGSIDLELPEAMYRDLSRRWPRVKEPKNLQAQFLIPGDELRLECPESDEWGEIRPPEAGDGLEHGDFPSLVESFKVRSRSLASEGRVVLYREKFPADLAERYASRLGRVLFVPSTLSGLPIADPYPEGRLVTRNMVEDIEGPSSWTGSGRFDLYLARRAKEGLNSAIWCPVLYCRYTVGMVLVSNGPDRPRALDLDSVDLSWAFARNLAWFLRRHGYFAATRSGEAPSGDALGAEAPAVPARVIDASPSGILAALPQRGPRVKPGFSLGLRLRLGDEDLLCEARVARGFEDSESRFYGLTLGGLPAAHVASMTRGLYGDAGAIPIEAGC
jgi:hypothetical protein